MKKVVTVAACALLAGLLLWTWSPWSADGARTSAPEGDVAMPAVANLQPAPARPADTVRVPATSPTTTTSEGRPTIFGRLLGPAGHALAGVALELVEAGHRLERPMRIVGTSDADGRFAFRFTPVATSHYYLAARPADAACHWWSWMELQPDDSKDLGDVRLDAAATLTVRVLDGSGKLLPHPWQVRAQWSSEDAGVHSWSYDRKAIEYPTVDMDRTGTADAHGEARLVALASGRVSVTASYGHARTARATVDLDAATPAEVALRYEGPAVEGVVALRVQRPTYDGQLLDPNRVVLQGPGIAPRHPSRALRFTDVPAGSYTLTIDDPRYEPCVVPHVQPGPEFVEVALRGSATIDLRVTDVPGGKPCTRYRVTASASATPFGAGSQTELAPMADRPDGRVVLAGVLPGTWRLFIFAPGQSMGEPIADLAPREHRIVTTSFGARGSIAGTVVEHDRATPCAKMPVELLRPAEVGDSAASAVHTPLDGPPPTADEKRAARTRIAMLWTDEKGAFAFASLDPGRYVVRALTGAQVEQVVTVEAGREARPQLVLPPASWITGKLIGPEGAVFQRFYLWFESESPPSGFSRGVEADGSFRLGPISPTHGRVLLHIGNHTNPHRLLEKITLEHGAPTVRTYDVRQFWPGTARVNVASNGRPVTDFTAWLHAPGASYFTGYHEDGDRQGSATVPEVVAGRYQVTICDKTQRAWKVTLPSLLELLPGGETEFACALQLAARDVRFVDTATGEPLAATKLVLMHVEPLQEQGSDWTTDADGTVRLALPVGESFYVRRHSDVRRHVYDTGQNLVSYARIVEPMRDQPIDFVWAEGAETDPLTVRVPRMQ